MVIDPQGQRLLSRRLVNDQPELLALIGEVAASGDRITWAVDLPDGCAVVL